jgi:UDP-2,3-diacylglucosamine pyrophosphatase LpxH
MDKRPVEVLVISDIHLGTYGCHAKELLTYLQSVSPKILILNGDIIDGWQFSKRYFPVTHMMVIREIMKMASQGVRVIYITGNHDEFLRRYTDVQWGHFQLTDKIVMEIDGKMTWIFHGDVFDATTKGTAKIIAKLGGHGYDLLIMANSCINWILRRLGKEKMSLSKRVKQSVKKAVAWIDNFEQTAAELAIEKEYDYVICGHIHQPQKREMANAKGKVTYMNSGDWIENLSSLEYYNGDWHIYQFDASKMLQPSTPVVKMHHHAPAINVVTDEIAYFFHSLSGSSPIVPTPGS